MEYIITSNMRNSISLFLGGIRKCSFCDSHGHSVESCRDETMLRFENDIYMLKNHIITFENVELFNTVDFIHAWITAQDVRLVTSFAVRKCGGLYRDNILELTTKIVHYLYQDDVNYLVLPVEEKEKEKEKESITIHLSLLEPTSEDECSICYEVAQKQVKYNCNHVFCADCVLESFRKIEKKSCAMCRSDITQITVPDEETEDDFILLLRHGI